MAGSKANELQKIRQNTKKVTIGSHRTQPPPPSPPSRPLAHTGRADVDAIMKLMCQIEQNILKELQAMEARLRMNIVDFEERNNVSQAENTDAILEGMQILC